MSLLNIIKQELERGKVMLPSGVEIPFVVTDIGEGTRVERGYCGQGYTFYVAPQDPFYGRDELLRRFFQGKGTVQFVNGLNLLLDNLLPNLQPFEKTPFELAHEKYLHYGCLKFKELIGKRVIGEEILVMADVDFQNNHGFSSGRRVFPQEEEQIFRKICINVYPHYDIARYIAKTQGHVLKRRDEINDIRLHEFSYGTTSYENAELDYLKEFLSKKVKSR